MFAHSINNNIKSYWKKTWTLTLCIFVSIDLWINIRLFKSLLINLTVALLFITFGPPGIWTYATFKLSNIHTVHYCSKSGVKNLIFYPFYLGIPKAQQGQYHLLNCYDKTNLFCHYYTIQYISDTPLLYAWKILHNQLEELNYIASVALLFKAHQICKQCLLDLAIVEMPIPIKLIKFIGV